MEPKRTAFAGLVSGKCAPLSDDGSPLLQESDNEKIDLLNGGRGLLGMYRGDRFHARTGDDDSARS